MKILLLAVAFLIGCDNTTGPVSFDDCARVDTLDVVTVNGIPADSTVSARMCKVYWNMP